MSPIWRLPRSNSPKPKRFLPGSSTLTDEASSGPCRILRSTSLRLRLDGFGKPAARSACGAVASAGSGS